MKKLINFTFWPFRNAYQVSLVIAGVNELEPEDVNLVVGQTSDDGLDEGDLLRQKVVENVDAVLEVDVLRLGRLLGLQNVFVNDLKWFVLNWTFWRQKILKVEKTKS